MDAEKPEYADEKECHGPKSEIEYRVFLFIMMGSMGKVPGEPAVCIRMALLACLHDPVESHVRIFVIHFLDIVGSMAVGTFGRFEVAQSISLAVDGFHIGFRECFVTDAALVRDFCHELVLLYFFDFVRGMAVLASGHFFPLFGPCYAVDALRVFIIYPLVACCAGSRDIFVINR